MYGAASGRTPASISEFVPTRIGLNHVSINNDYMVRLLSAQRHRDLLAEASNRRLARDYLAAQAEACSGVRPGLWQRLSRRLLRLIGGPERRRVPAGPTSGAMDSLPLSRCRHNGAVRREHKQAADTEHCLSPVPPPMTRGGAADSSRAGDPR